MRFHSTVLSAIFALAFCAWNPGAAETWTCNLTENTQSGFVAEQVTVVRLEDTGAIKVKDAMIEKYRDGWLRGKIDVENDKRITFVWQLPFVKNPPTISASSQTNLFYSMTLQKPGLAARMQVSSFPHGTGRLRTYSGKGQCVLSK